MPYHLTWEPRGVVRRYVGRVPLSERVASLEAICADPRFDLLRYSITDFLAVEWLEGSAESSREIAARHIGPHATNPRIVMAAVAVEEQHLALIRDFVSLRFTDAPYRAFPTEVEARRWIADTTGLRLPEGSVALSQRRSASV